MAYKIPDFVVPVDVYTVAAGAHTLRFSTMGNMMVGRTVKFPIGAGEENTGITALSVQLALPALTDVRDASCGGDSDIVDCPAGSGRFYIVLGVEDVGKTFPNEFRVASLAKIWNFVGNGAGLTAPWPTPIP